MALEESVASPGTQVTDVFETPYGCWESIQGPLEEKKMLLVTGQLPQPPNDLFFLKPVPHSSGLHSSSRKGGALTRS